MWCHKNTDKYLQTIKMETKPSANNKGRRSIRSKESSIKSIGSNKSVRKSHSIDITNENKSEITLTEKEEKTLIVSSVWQDILTTAFDQIYENDLDKETVYFVSRCSRLAWRALIEWNYQRRDPGEYREAYTEDLDVEPATSAKDSWASTSVQVGSEAAEGAQTRTSTTQSDLGTTEVTLSTVTDTCKTTEPSETRDTVTRAASKKATDVARELLQIMRKRPQARSDLDTVTGGRLGTMIKSMFELKKDSYELPSPVAMQPKYFPPARVEVDYAVAAGTRGVVSKKPPKTKTIHLKCLLPGEAEAAERAARQSRIGQRRATITSGTLQV